MLFSLSLSLSLSLARSPPRFLVPWQVPSSQVSDDEEFAGGPWGAMKAEMGLDERNPACFLHSYSVVMVLRKVIFRVNKGDRRRATGRGERRGCAAVTNRGPASKSPITELAGYLRQVKPRAALYFSPCSSRTAVEMRFPGVRPAPGRS